MGTVRFRESGVADAKALWSTKHAAIGDIGAGEYTEAELRAWKPDDEAVPDFRRAIESDTFDIVIAETDGETVGYAVLNRSEERIDAVFVHPDHAREGIATSLVRQLETRARMYGIAGLTIVSSLNARSFYESLGYRDTGREARTIDGVEIEFAIMHKEL